MPGIKIKVSTEDAQLAVSKLRADLEKLGLTSKLTSTQIKELEARTVNKLGMDAASAASQRLASSVGMSKTEIDKLNKTLGISSVETDMLSKKVGILNKNVGSMIGTWITLSIAMGAAFKVAKSGIGYLSEIETATLGIAAAYMTGGTYVDKLTGKALDASEALRASQADSAAIIKDLEFANLKTIATLDQLINAYQVTLPVALAKGFDRTQVKDFTVAMVQAAGAIGLPMEQLGEETRSLLTESINPRNSRIATVLGLRNEDIRKFKGDAQGLFDFLMQKLDAYRTAGVAAQTTWAGLWSNTKDIMLQGMGRGFEPLFEAIKYEMQSFANSMVTIDEKTKRINWNPEFLSGIDKFKRGINSIIADVYRLGMLLDKIGGTFTSLQLLTSFKKETRDKWAGKNEEYRQRYMESEKAVQTLAMREQGFQLATPETDAYMRKGNKGNRYTQTVVSVGSKEEGTEQLLRFVKDNQKGSGSGASWLPKDKKTTEDEDSGIKSLRESWEKKRIDIDAKLATLDLTEESAYQKAVIEAKKEGASLRKEYGKIGGEKPGSEIYNKSILLEEKMIAKAQLEEDKNRFALIKEEGEREIERRTTLLDLAENEGTLHKETIGDRLTAAEDLVAFEKELLTYLQSANVPIDDKTIKAQKEAIINAEKKLSLIKKDDREQEKKNKEELATLRQSEINDAIFLLDKEEMEGRSHLSTLQERLNFRKQSLDLEKEILKTTDKNKDLSGYISQQKVVNENEKELLNLKKEIALADPYGAVKYKINELANDYNDIGKQMYDFTATTFNGMADVITDFCMNGKADFSSFAQSVIRDLTNMVIKAQLSTLANALFNNQGGQSGVGSLGSSIMGFLFGSGAGSTTPSYAGAASNVSMFSGGTPQITPQTFHLGGVVGRDFRSYGQGVPEALFYNAPRLHEGLRAGEFPAILERGEKVTSKRDAEKEKDSTKGQPVTVKIVNQSGTAVQATQNTGAQFDGQQYVVTVFLDALERNVGGMRDVLGGGKR